jgi:hypothetical protein
MRREISSRRNWKVSVHPGPSAPSSDGKVTIRVPCETDSDLLAAYGADENLLAGLWVGLPSGAVAPEDWARHCVGEWLMGWTKEGSDLGPALIVDGRDPHLSD